MVMEARLYQGLLKRSVPRLDLGATPSGGDGVGESRPVLMPPDKFFKGLESQVSLQRDRDFSRGL